MDEVRLKDELMARLSNELDRPALQVIDGALSSVLRNYEVAKRFRLLHFLWLRNVFYFLILKPRGCRHVHLPYI